MQSFDDELNDWFGYDKDDNEDKKPTVYPPIKIPTFRPIVNTSSATRAPAFGSLRAPITSSSPPVPVQSFRHVQQPANSSYYAPPAQQRPVLVKNEYGQDQMYVPPHMHQQHQHQQREPHYARRAPEPPLRTSSTSPSQRRSNQQQPPSRKRKYDQFSDEEDKRYFSDSEDEKDRHSRQRETRKYRSPRREKRYDDRDRDFEENRGPNQRSGMEIDQREAQVTEKERRLEEPNAQLNERLNRMENMMNAQASSQNSMQYSSPQIFQPQQQQQMHTPTAASSFNHSASFQNNASNQYASPSTHLTPLQSAPHIQMQTTNTPIVDHSHRVSAYTSKQGIKLINISIIPDLYRTIFKFQMFNAVQSLAFPTLYDTDENMVISAPTGAGKTVLFEIGMLRIFRTDAEGQIVYLAPTKSLCTERVTDWRNKFATANIRCAELTGDTSMHAIQEAKKAKIIVTTPEKWDSVTRRTKEHMRWYDKVRLFCIDEVHLLAEERGSVLEVIVSRMKNLGTPLRFLAVSATVPNIEDVASWLGAGGSGSNDMMLEDKGMARVFKFNDEFRPCPLHKIVNAYPNRGNESAFENSLNYQLLDVITKNSSGKPVLVFCPTRKGVAQAAKVLLTDYKKALVGRQAPPWPKPTKSHARYDDPLATELAEAGIGMHHAGLSLSDKRLTEAEFLSGKLRIVCATSTLAVGVNLPARMVVVKGTKMWNTNESKHTDYSDLDILQMMGRAGRPQFDDRGVAVIMCTSEDKNKYDALMRSQTMLESCLHQTLVEHINSEIAIKTISKVEDALKWMRNSFLYVRIKKNPEYYRSLTANRVDENGNPISLATDPEGRLEEMVTETVKELVDKEFVEDFDNGDIASTQYGDMLCQYSIRLKTFSELMEIPPNPKMTQILEAISKAAEFGDIRFRSGEKKAYQDMNTKNAEDMGIKYPVAIVDDPSDKVNTLLQLTLAGTNMRELKVAGSSPGYEIWAVMNHAARVTSCLIDIAATKQDVTMLKYSLELRRCIAAKTWENIPNVMCQVAGIGSKGVIALTEQKIRDLRDLRNASAEIVGGALNRNFPLAMGIINAASNLPWFTLQLNHVSERVKPDGVSVSFDVLVGLENLQVTINNSKKNNSKITVSIQIMTSDNEWIDYERIKLKKIADDDNGIYKYRRNALLTKPSQKITAFVSCEETAGNGTHAALSAKANASVYPIPDLRARSKSADDELDPLAPDVDVPMVDDEPKEKATISKAKPTKPAKEPAVRSKVPLSASDPEKLENGRYKCSHTTCKANCNHVCCRDGVAKPPRKKNGNTATKTAGKIAASTSALPDKTQATTAKKTNIATGKASISTSKTNNATSSMPSLTHDADTVADDDPDDDLPEVSEILSKFLANKPKINEKGKGNQPVRNSQAPSAKKTPLARKASSSSSSLADISQIAPTKKTGSALHKDKDKFKLNKSFSSDSLPNGDPPESRDDEMQIDAQNDDYNHDTTPRASTSKKPLFRKASNESQDDGSPSVAAISTPKIKQISRLQKLSQKKRKKNPFIDDEAELSGDADDTGGEMTDDNPGSLIDFIDDHTEIEEDDEGSDVDELQESETKSKPSRDAFSPEV